MEHYNICKIFEEGIKFGIEHGIFPKESLFDHFESLGEKFELEDFNDKTKPVLWTVIIAGFNHGSNLRSKVMPDELEIFDMFDNLIEGKPLTNDDPMYYEIKAKIEAIITEPKKLSPKECAEALIKDKFPIKQYEGLQAERKRRLLLWEERNIPYLAEKERELIAYGEEVIKYMKSGGIA